MLYLKCVPGSQSIVIVSNKHYSSLMTHKHVSCYPLKIVKHYIPLLEKSKEDAPNNMLAAVYIQIS